MVDIEFFSESPKKSTRFEVTDWKLGDKEVSISQTTTHLGILRSTKNDITSNVEDRAKSSATVGQPTYVVPMWVPTLLRSRVSSSSLI
jgi:hypothetical protein